MSTGQSPATRTAPNAQGSGTGGQRPHRHWLLRYGWRWIAVLLAVLVLALLLAPWWGRPLLKNAIKSALLAEGWQTVELQVSSLGTGQAALTGITLERAEARLDIPEISLRYDLFELLTKRHIHSAIVREAHLQAHFAQQAADLVVAPLVADWPNGEHLPFRRIYISDARITAQPSAGLQTLRFNALVEHTPPRGRHSAGTAKLWASAESPAPYAQLEISFEANLREQTLKATLDSEFRDLPQWRALPLPPEAQEVLGIVREQLSLQAGASVKRRTLENWMLFGQSPAAVYTAPEGSHIEALGVDFGVNVQGTDRLDYGWLRTASGAANNSNGSIEWQNLRSELKPGHYLNAHIDSATLRVELSSIARELMPSLRLGNEFPNLWRNTPWLATDLSANIFAPEPAKNRPAFMRLGANLKLGTLEYPWEKLEPLSPAFEAELRRTPLLETLTRPAPRTPSAGDVLLLPNSPARQ